MVEAIWLPAAAAVIVLALSVSYTYYTVSRSVLSAAVYDDLRVGDRQSLVEVRLPEYQADAGRRPESAPADPPGTDECRIYRMTIRSMSPAFRVCFTGGVLSHKDVVTIDLS